VGERHEVVHRPLAAESVVGGQRRPQRHRARDAETRSEGEVALGDDPRPVGHAEAIQDRLDRRHGDGVAVEGDGRRVVLVRTDRHLDAVGEGESGTA
jgi:hypothetical protein